MPILVHERSTQNLPINSRTFGIASRVPLGHCEHMFVFTSPQYGSASLSEAGNAVILNPTPKAAQQEHGCGWNIHSKEEHAKFKRSAGHNCRHSRNNGCESNGLLPLFNNIIMLEKQQYIVFLLLNSDLILSVTKFNCNFTTDNCHFLIYILPLRRRS